MLWFVKLCLLCKGVHLVTMATQSLLEVHVVPVTATLKAQLVKNVIQLLVIVLVFLASQVKCATNVSHDTQLLTASADVRVRTFVLMEVGGICTKLLFFTVDFFASLLYSCPQILDHKGHYKLVSFSFSKWWIWRQRLIGYKKMHNH